MFLTSDCKERQQCTTYFSFTKNLWRSKHLVQHFPNLLREVFILRTRKKLKIIPLRVPSHKHIIDDENRTMEIREVAAPPFPLKIPLRILNISPTYKKKRDQKPATERMPNFESEITENHAFWQTIEETNRTKNDRNEETRRPLTYDRDKFLQWTRHSFEISTVWKLKGELKWAWLFSGTERNEIEIDRTTIGTGFYSFECRTKALSRYMAPPLICSARVHCDALRQERWGYD